MSCTSLEVDAAGPSPGLLPHPFLPDMARGATGTGAGPAERRGVGHSAGCSFRSSGTAVPALPAQGSEPLSQEDRAHQRGHPVETRRAAIGPGRRPGALASRGRLRMTPSRRRLVAWRWWSV